MARFAAFLYQRLGLPGAGLIFLLEGLGAPLPVEIPLWIIGMRMSPPHPLNSYWDMVFFMWGTTVVGNSLGYVLGYYGGRPMVMKLMSWFRIRQEQWERVEGWFQKHGLNLVVFTRWINWGFAQNMWLCGITRVKFGRFFAVMAVNDFLWAMAWTWLARSALTAFRRHSTRYLHSNTMRIGLGALAATLIILGVWMIIRRIQRRREENRGHER